MISLIFVYWIILQCFVREALGQYKLYFEELNTDNLTVNDIVGWKFFDASYTETNIFANGAMTERYDQTRNKGINQCGNQIGNKIFGGYNYFDAEQDDALVLQKIYNISLPHWKIKFKVQLFKIDSWNLDDTQPTYDKLTIYLDKQKVKRYDWNCCDGLIDLCGATKGTMSTSYNQALNDAIEMFETEITHTQNTLTVHFYDTHDSPDNETWGLRDIQIFIQQCHLSCMGCSGPSDKQCTACYPGSILQTDGSCACSDNTLVRDLQRIQNCLSTSSNYSSCKICSNTCYLNSQYVDKINGLCIDCDLTCQQCTQKNNNCISCKDTTFLVGNVCQSCIIGCKSCSKNTTCNICLNGYFLDQNICVQCPAQCTSCSNTSLCTNCSDGFVNVTNQCIACPIGCKSCTQQTDATFQCQSCISNYFLLSQQCVASKNCGTGFYGDPISGICTQKCQNGYFPFKLTQKCEKCHPNCSKCFGKEKNNCYECNTSYFFYNFTCENTCPTGTQENSIVQQCNPTIKNSESSNYQAQFGQECYIACQMGKWYDVNQWTCVSCDPSCLACEITNPQNCTMCKENQYLDPSTKKCVNICTNYYHDSDHRQCEIQCFQGYYISANFCYKCEFIGCLNCTESACLACDSSLKRYFSGGECVCQDGYFSDGIRDECFTCATGCKKCTSLNQCQQCDSSNNFILQNGQCVCIQGMYFNQTSGVCENCHYSCLSCSNSTSCDVCDGNSNRYLNGLCVCLASFFEIVSDKKEACTPCQQSCNLCTDLLTCQSCNTNYPNRILTNSQCTCKPLFYEDNPTDYSCTPFPEGCIEMNLKLCSKCDKSVGYALVDKRYCSKDCPAGQFYHPDLVECVTNCGTGYFINYVTKQCQKCIKDCLSCTDNIKCDSCIGGVFLLPDTKICSQVCPYIGYVLQYQQCFKCPNNCKTCKSFTTCDECYLPYVKSSSQGCFCTQGNYFNDQSNTCESCPLHCNECLNANQCLVCSQSNRELITEINGDITCKCQKNGYYEDQITKECMQCMPNCEECQNKDSCTKCNELSYITDKNVCECSPQYFKENDICKICTLNGCLQCTSSSVCLKCKSNYIKNTKQQCELPPPPKPPIIVDPKPDDGTGNKGKEEQMCHISCDSCSGKLQTDCTSCTSSRYLTEQGECLCKRDYLENVKQTQQCSLSKEIDTTLVRISSTINLSSMSSTLALALFSYNVNISFMTIILSQSIGNLGNALNYAHSRYYEYQNIETFEAFSIFPLLPTNHFMSNPDQQLNQERGTTFDKIIIPLGLLLFLVVSTLICYLLRNKYRFCDRIYQLFQYHILLLAYLLCSNHIAVQSFKQIFSKNNDFLPDFLISIISLVCIACFMIYFIYCNYQLNKKSDESVELPTQTSFLNYINNEYFFTRMIWTITDLRRYSVIATIFLSSNIKTVLIVNITFSLLFIFLYVKMQPFIDEISYNPQSLDNTNNISDIFKMNIFNPQLALIEEEKPKGEKFARNLMSQSKLGYMIEAFILIYFALLFTNQMYDQLIILQTAVIIMLILTSFVLITNLLKIIQQILQLKKGTNNNSVLIKKQNQKSQQKQQLEEFFHQLQEQIPQDSKQSPYNIQVKKNFMFSSNQISKQSTSIYDKTNIIKPQNIQNQQSLSNNSPNRRNQCHLKKTSSSTDKMEK